MSRNLKLCFVSKMYNVIVDFSTKSFRLENDLAEFYGLTEGSNTRKAHFYCGYFDIIFFVTAPNNRGRKIIFALLRGVLSDRRTGLNRFLI